MSPEAVAPEREPEQRRDREVEFFDEFVKKNGAYDVLSDGAYRRLVHFFRELVRPRAGERCIDLGCGTGAFTKRLRSLGLRLEGMDISGASVEFANAHAQGETYRQGDITDTGLPGGSYDIVMYSGVLHHFDSPELRKRVIEEGFRLLSPGGRLFAFDPNAFSPSMFLYRDPRSPLFSPEGKTDNEVLLRSSELESQLRQAGFCEVDVSARSGITFGFVEGRTARRLLPLYNLYEQIIRFSPLERWLGTFLISFARK